MRGGASARSANRRKKRIEGGRQGILGGASSGAAAFLHTYVCLIGTRSLARVFGVVVGGRVASHRSFVPSRWGGRRSRSRASATSAIAR